MAELEATGLVSIEPGSSSSNYFLMSFIDSTFFSCTVIVSGTFYGLLVTLYLYIYLEFFSSVSLQHLLSFFTSVIMVLVFLCILRRAELKIQKAIQFPI